jgi:hypothetical protein
MALGGMINTTSFTKPGTGIQASLRFCFTNLNACNVGVIDGEDL